MASYKDAIPRYVTPFDIARAIGSTMLKFYYLQDTFISRKQPILRYQSSFIGDLAKSIVRFWLEENGFKVEDWDEVRDNWKSQRKPYDLSVNSHFIEIKSSIFRDGDDICAIFEKEHIIHPVKQKMKEITIQVIWSGPGCNKAYICAWILDKDFNDEKYLTYRHVKGRKVPFYMVPLKDDSARPPNELLDYLTQ